MFFKVNNNKWKIVYCDSSSPDLKRSDGSYTLGVADNNKKCVFISNILDGYMFDKVLCHELTHVFCFEFNYIIDLETEEIVADFMSLFGRKIIYLLDDLISVLKRAAA